jgi:hypothetical protein
MNRRQTLVRIGALSLAGLTFASGGVRSARAATPAEFSAAERRLFVDDQLRGLPRTARIEYAYAKRGSLEENVDDAATLTVGPPGANGARPVHVDFLSDARRLELPDVDAATGNPMILFFLERDVREMHRLTGGSANYYRKRIRMALAGGAQVDSVTAEVAGRRVSATEIRIAPYIDDPARSRYERFADKRYRFTLSDDVPGKVVEMASSLRESSASANAPEIIAESLRFTRMS